VGASLDLMKSRGGRAQDVAELRSGKEGWKASFMS